MSLYELVEAFKPELAAKLGVANMDAIQFTMQKGERLGYAQISAVNVIIGSSIKEAILTVALGASDEYEELNLWAVGTMELIANTYSKPQCVGGLTAQIEGAIDSEPYQHTPNQGNTSKVTIFRGAITFQLLLRYTG